MTDIPDDVMQAANAAYRNMVFTDDDVDGRRMTVKKTIARAIMAERERIACIADEMEADFEKDAREAETAEARSNASYASDVMMVFAAAIRIGPTPPKGGEHD